MEINYSDLYKIPIKPNTKISLRKWKGEKVINSKYNVAILTGKQNNLIVLDIDKNDEGIEEFEKYIKEYGEPDTVKQITINGGYHYFFQYENKDEECKYLIETYIKNKSKYRGKGIDIRTDGGYIMSYPSKIDGKQYTYERTFEDTKVLEMPKELILFLLEGTQNKEIKEYDTKDGIYAYEMNERSWFT